ncbi:MAG: hypothetical protein DRP95_02185 [Candidatus Latescibacterota bacterium]|nr:MAG: hypothetical protein DRP95_02185 [Candidatus Latescibacterota bacterium]
MISEGCPKDEFRAYLRGIEEALGRGERFVMGVSDMVPPDASWDRLLRLGEWAVEKGPVPWT